MNGDPGRHGRCAAVDGWVYTRPCKTKNNDVLLRVPKTTILVLDIERYPWQWLIHLRYIIKKTFILKGKRLD